MHAAVLTGIPVRRHEAVEQSCCKGMPQSASHTESSKSRCVQSWGSRFQSLGSPLPFPNLVFISKSLGGHILKKIILYQSSNFEEFNSLGPEYGIMTWKETHSRGTFAKPLPSSPWTANGIVNFLSSAVRSKMGWFPCSSLKFSQKVPNICIYSARW